MLKLVVTNENPLPAEVGIREMVRAQIAHWQGAEKPAPSLNHHSPARRWPRLAAFSRPDFRRLPEPKTTS
jgi:hypothetical protein